MLNERGQKILKTLGPGILFASTAIGVSHLVQSTRAGAMAGWGLTWAILLANAAKYPFFEFGSRYAAATGTSLIDGYRKMGRGAAWAYLLITVATCFFVLGAIGLVTASFLDNLLGVSARTGGNATPAVAVAVVTGSAALLFWGAYRALDRLIKVIATVLVISTVVAFIAAILGPSGQLITDDSTSVDIWQGAGLAFFIALVGWMPSAIDLSTWNSIWTLERAAESGYRPSVRETLHEFNFGYLISAVLALAFLGLGAMLLHATETELPSSPAAFAAAIVGLYTTALGPWSSVFVGAAAFSAMLGTIVACFDGYSRSLSASIQSLKPRSTAQLSRVLLVTLAAGALTLILLFPGDIRILVDIATTLSFLIAPVVAAANFHLVTRKDFPEEARPGRFLKGLSWLGLVFLIGFGGLFLYSWSIGA